MGVLSGEECGVFILVRVVLQTAFESPRGGVQLGIANYAK